MTAYEAPTTDRKDSLQPTSREIWASKYALTDREGKNLDQTVPGTLARVARALASVEEHPEQWESRFLWALHAGALPAGRILANAGAGEHKPNTSLINCTVSGTIDDSMDGILHANHEAGLTLKAGCGIGYEFSTLRPNGAHVSGAGASTSGPLPFMDEFDATCRTVASAGGRRGAQMATFDVAHPDVLDFIRAKRENGRLRQFNLSLLITEEFMEAVRNDRDWPLVFPVQATSEAEAAEACAPGPIHWRNGPATDGHYRNEQGQVACRVYRVIKARALWDEMMSLTYDYAEPGFILIDRVNEMNNNWFCETIRASNPCGEQMLPPHGSCLLGSVNLARFVRHRFTDNAAFDWDAFTEVVRVFTRMLDNVVEISGLPLAAQRHELETKRRHGMGFLGLGSALTLLGLRYGSPEAAAFTEKVTRRMAITGWEEALVLAEEKGPAPVLAELHEITPAMMAQRPEMAEDGIQVGDRVPGRVLHARYSRYMQQLAGVVPDLVERLAETGARFTHHTSIAPTGTIALSLGNNVSNGIEPSFAHSYKRNVIREGRKTKEQVEVLSYEFLAYRESVNPAADPSDPLPAAFVVSDDITPDEHIAMQAAAQRWVDASISKTVNVPTDMPFDAFKDIYLKACEQGLKGCTTFRFNPEAFSGVLVRDEDLARTRYVFTLEDGETVEVSGDEKILYDGEEHTASNLYDALKEGLYGRF